MCAQLDIDTYDKLLSYCLSKRIVCDVTQKQYDEIFTKQKVVKNEVKQDSKSAQPKTRRRGRKPKAKTDGNANK